MQYAAKPMLRFFKVCKVVWLSLTSGHNDKDTHQQEGPYVTAAISLQILFYKTQV